MLRRFIMKKHLKVILILLLVLAICGVAFWFVFTRTKVEPLPKTVNTFVEHENTKTLQERIKTSQSLYSTHYFGDTRLDSLGRMLEKLDTFEQDLNIYLVLCNAKAKTTQDLTKSYNSLSKSRTALIKDCDEYIVRMKGNTLAEGQPIKNLYNLLVNKVSNYLQEYNKCFKSTVNYVFTSVTSSNNIKFELYGLYSEGVHSTLTNMTNNQFKELSTINILNNKIKLNADSNDSNNISLPKGLEGGEFNIKAINFKKYYNASNKTDLLTNFYDYYSNVTSINPSIETSNEKLAVYYFEQIMEA